VVPPVATAPIIDSRPDKVGPVKGVARYGGNEFAIIGRAAITG